MSGHMALTRLPEARSVKSDAGSRVVGELVRLRCGPHPGAQSALTEILCTRSFLAFGLVVRYRLGVSPRMERD